MQKLFAGMKKILGLVLSILPDSPFREFIDKLDGVPFLGYLNWFIPISDFLFLLAVWGSAVTLFYVYSMILRYIKAIE